ncbi:MAG: 23S rRNA (pseudouridine(1915)-N(3))-methyltransferase RlmH [Bacteroidales bacterium]|nr:23S rRNA (pseudouridine(1915)-N(3))-methyltransferase RlmH [Bacteroidales bacterium]
MKVKLIQIGKTDLSFIVDAIEYYHKKIVRYHPFEVLTIPDIKNRKSLNELQQKKAEADLILKHLQSSDYIVLLDENGHSMNSVQFSDFIQNSMIQSIKQLVFIIGGPYGFDEEIYRIASSKIALSKMTFSHQLVRVIFAEQLYRANTIIKGEPYHHV